MVCGANVGCAPALLEISDVQSNRPVDGAGRCAMTVVADDAKVLLPNDMLIVHVCI